MEGSSAPPPYSFEDYPAVSTTGIHSQVVVVEQPVPISVQPHTQERYQLPYTARILSIVFTVVCSVIIWLPGIYCAVTALVLAIMGTQEEQKNKQESAKSFSIISLSLIALAMIAYPVLLPAVGIFSFAGGFFLYCLACVIL